MLPRQTQKACKQKHSDSCHNHEVVCAPSTVGRSCSSSGIHAKHGWPTVCKGAGRECK